MNTLKAIIFDLDGTLLDTLDDITNSCNYTLNQLKLSHVKKEDVRRYLGNGAKALWMHILKHNINYLDEALSIYLPYLETHSKIRTKPYEGMNELLHQLKKTYQLAVVSNKHQEAVSEIIDYYFKGMFDVVIGERPGIPKKPDPAPLNLAIKELRLNKHEVLFIGDSEVDIQTAKHADVKVIGVSWGFRDYTELKHEKPDYLILKVDQIQKIIQGE
ncbi:HAD family hydrolase [Acholeplasma laidlawii]|uniref:HAD family hydrolase n=1 Tax=Acholeplasma laidlawii TaxID=2148 RepID=UPI003F926A6C